MRNTVFKSRTDAGKQLAEKLLSYRAKKPLVLALPRGGVPVGYEAAQALNAPLDTLIVRKIGAPSDPEFGVGAIAPGDVLVLNTDTIEVFQIPRKDIDPIIAREKEEMSRRMARYKSGSYSGNVKADTVILVDDGLATGVTARAAIESVRLLRQPKKIVCAAPICARDTAARLKSLADEVVCVSEVDNLISIGQWYENFHQLTDEEVIEYLKKAEEFCDGASGRS